MTSYFARIHKDACHESGIVTICVIFVPQAQSDQLAVCTYRNQKKLQETHLCTLPLSDITEMVCQHETKENE